MKDKKHIDELFQEGFQGFEPSPSPEVWRSIASKLKKDEDDRKVIPLWWRLGGVAALLALLLTVGKFVFFPTDNATNPVVIEETTLDNSKEELSPERTTNKGEDAVVDGISNDPSQNRVANQDEDASENPSKNEISTQPQREQVITSQGNVDEAVAGQKYEQAPTHQNSKNSRNPQMEDAVTSPITNSDIQEATAANQQDPLKDSSNKEGAAVNPLIKEEINTQVTEAVTTTTELNNTTSSDNPLDSSEKDLKEEIEKETGVTGVTIAATAGDTNKETAQQEEQKTKQEDEKPSIFDAIEEAKEAVAEQQQEPTQDGGWEVTPNFGPVFYNSLSEGSSLDPSFADNSQSGDVNFSYGVAVSYHINDRLSIRSGVNNVNVGYTTGGIELGTGPVSSALRSVDYGNNPVVLSAFDRGSIRGASDMPESMNPLDSFTLKSEGGNAEISQSITYYEIPMELKYALVNNRIGINMIGGFSTLLLGNNEVAVQDGDFRSTLGEANNLNNLSFSTNIGLGFDYKFSRRFKFNIEPMFKYQLNPYSDSSVNFRPYYLGVYSGLSFRF